MKHFMVMTEEDCISDINWKECNLEDSIVVLNLETFSRDFQEAKFQLVRCKGGFGCSPERWGSKIFVEDLFEGGGKYSIRRNAIDILGLATDEAINTWKSVYAPEREDLHQKEFVKNEEELDKKESVSEEQSQFENQTLVFHKRKGR